MTIHGNLVRDGILAAGVLVVCLLAIRVLEIEPTVGPFLAGTAATVGFEYLAAHRRSRVNAAWQRPAVRAGAIAGALLLVAIATRLERGWVPVSMAGALCTYLALLFAVGAGIVDPPGSR